MNIPPSIYLKKFDVSNLNDLEDIYVNNKSWKKFDQHFITHASADPQIYKTNTAKTNEVYVRLASNFKVADFEDIESSKKSNN